MSTTIECPHCHRPIDIDEILRKQVELSVRADYEKILSKKLTDEMSRVRAEESQKASSRIAEMQKAMQDKDRIAAEQQAKIIEGQQKEEEYLLLKQRFENSEAEKNNAIKRAELEVERRTREKIEKENEEIQKMQIENVKREVEAETQRKALVQQEELERKIKAEYELKLREKDVKLSQTNRSLEEAQRKIHQNSMQIQGEAQEKLLAEILQELFPDDRIERKTTGAEESDVKQVVIDKFGYQNVECGVIQYESKNTKTWSNAWIDKLIADGEAARADVLVLVTQTMPAINKELHRVKNVWVCPFKDIKIVSNTLRQGLVEIYKAKGTQIDRADKMERLFDFMMSPSFKNYIENIYVGISNIKQSYEKEKKALEKIWKNREREFEYIMSSCVNLVASIQSVGIETLEIEALDIKALASQNSILE